MKLHSPEGMTRVLKDLIADELSRLRHGDPAAIIRDLTDDQRLGPDGFGMDSFEFMTVSATLARMFHIYDLGAEDYLLARPTVRGWRDLILELADSDAGTEAAGPAHLITFLSSGSTGARTPVEHTRGLLVEEMRFFRELLGVPARIFVTVPTHHIYGYLFGALLPDLYSGIEADDESTSPVPVLPLRGSALSRPRSACARSGAPVPEAGDLLIAFPDALSRLLEAGVLPCPGLTVVTSTAPCPADIASRVRNGGSRLVEVYGSSETAGIGYRDSTREAYELLPYWQRDGEALRRPVSENVPDGKTTQVTPPDELEWTDERRFLPLRRRDGAVVVGGRNVFPNRVEAAIRDLPGVVDAAVRLYDAPDGARLKAFVVPAVEAGPASTKPDLEALESTIRSALSGVLRSAEQPAVYRFGAELPRNSMGKLMDF